MIFIQNYLSRPVWQSPTSSGTTFQALLASQSPLASGRTCQDAGSTTSMTVMHQQHQPILSNIYTEAAPIIIVFGSFFDKALQVQVQISDLICAAQHSGKLNACQGVGSRCLTSFQQQQRYQTSGSTQVLLVRLKLYVTTMMWHLLQVSCCCPC